MSNKTYSADQVAKKVLEKYHTLAKGLFADKLECAPDKCEDTKESVFREIKWALDDIKQLKELSWTVEQEAPGAKDMFDKEFESKKAKLTTLIRRHKAMKKSEDGEEDYLAQAEELWKAEKGVNLPAFGTTNSVAGAHARKEGPHQKDAAKEEHKKTLKDLKAMPKPNLPKSEKDQGQEIKKADDSKLKAFLEAKKAKKTGKMEKMLGMNSNAQPASTGLEAPKPKINMPGESKK